MAGYTLLMLRALWLCTLAAVTMQVAPADLRSVVADRVTRLTRDTKWTRVSAVPIPFQTFHPQGLVKIGDTFFLSSVEVLDRMPGRELDISSRWMQPAAVSPTSSWVKAPSTTRADLITTAPASGLRSPSTGRTARSIVYRVDPDTMRAVVVLRFPADHIGAIVHNTDDDTLHGVSWGSRRVYRWTIGRDGRVANSGVGVASQRTLNPSHYVDYQDCKYAGNRRMLCTGVTEIRQSADAQPFRLGGLELVDLQDGRPLHQVPILLWTERGLDMTHNPSWIESTATGLRAYFIPEDDNSTLYVFEAATP